MAIWAAVFLPLLLARPLTVILTGLIDTQPITGWRVPEMLLGLALIAVAAWAMRSTLKHFTLRRALGGDHFREEIRRLPEGDRRRLRSTPTTACMASSSSGLWGICRAASARGTRWSSALFQHAYIWVHMYCTEAPDMRRLYG